MSTTYTYTLSELDALGVTDISISYCSLASDTAKLRLPLRYHNGAGVPWVYGDRIRIVDEREQGSPCIYNGRVKTMPVSLSSTSYELQVELANDVDVLNSTTFAYIDDDGKVCYAQSFYNARAEGESPYGERLTSSRTVCERCFDWALAGGAMDCQRSVHFDSTILGVAGTGSQSCWGLIRQALKWVPDAVTWTDYNATPSCLHFGTSRSTSSICIDATTRTMEAADGTPCGSFEGLESVSLSPRPDLVPPVCAMTGRLQQVLPEGGDVRAPGAFIYHIRSGGGGAANEEAVTKVAKAASVESAPWQVVRGAAAPLTLSNAMGNVNMRSPANEAPLEILRWWVGEGGFALLNKVGVGNLVFGQPLFEPVSADDAYPADEEDEDGAPANYDSPDSWGTLYRLKSGSFPARAKASHNPSGLRWCRGKLTQDVWLKPGATLPSTVTEEQVREFFTGTWPMSNGSSAISTRYARLTMEAVWINRRRTKYRQGDNKGEATKAAAVALADDEEASGTPAVQSATDADYLAALEDFYAATRKLYYDGSITLSGVTGCPGEWLAHGINLSGLLPEWSSMESPCNTVDYNPITRQVTLTLGSRENLTMDELLERQDLGRLQSSSRSNGDTENPLDPETSKDSSDDSTGDEEEDEDTEMVAPSVSAYVSTTATGKPLNPWEVYQQDGKWYLNGGSVKTSDGWVTVGPKDISSVYAANRRFHAVWSEAKRKVIYRYTTIS